MNIQAMMKQAQQMQKEMMSTKNEIDNSLFETKKNFVKVTMSGDKKIIELVIEKNNLEDEDIEMLQDLVILTINETLDKIDKETEAKMGKHTKGMPGLF